MSVANLLVHGLGGAQPSHLRKEYLADSFAFEDRIGESAGQLVIHEGEEARTSTIRLSIMIKLTALPDPSIGREIITYWALGCMEIMVPIVWSLKGVWQGQGICLAASIISS